MSLHAIQMLIVEENSINGPRLRLPRVGWRFLATSLMAIKGLVRAARLLKDEAVAPDLHCGKPFGERFPEHPEWNVFVIGVQMSGIV